MSQIFSKLVVDKLLSTKSVHKHNFITKFVKIHDIFKDFTGNHVNEYVNIRCPGVVPKFSDLEVIALSATAEAYGIDSENYLFKRLESEKGDNSCRTSLPDASTIKEENRLHGLGKK